MQNQQVPAICWIYYLFCMNRLTKRNLPFFWKSSLFFCHETRGIDFTCGKSRSLRVCKPMTCKIPLGCFNHWAMVGLKASWAFKVSINLVTGGLPLPIAPLNAVVKIFEKRDLKAPFLAITAYSTNSSCIWRKLLKSLLFHGVIVEKYLSCKVEEVQVF